VIRNIEIIGEAARNIERASPAFIAEHPGIPWSTMIATRNRVSHGYMTLNLSLVWKTIRNDLPELEKPIRTLRVRNAVPNAARKHGCQGCRAQPDQAVGFGRHSSAG